MRNFRDFRGKEKSPPFRTDNPIEGAKLYAFDWDSMRWDASCRYWALFGGIFHAPKGGVGNYILFWGNVKPGFLRRSSGKPRAAANDDDHIDDGIEVTAS